MTDTFDTEAIDGSARQLATVMGANIFNRVILAVNVVNRNRGIAVEDEFEFARQAVDSGANAKPVHKYFIRRRSAFRRDKSATNSIADLSRLEALLQIFSQNLKTQIITFWNSKTLITIRKWFVNAGA